MRSVPQSDFASYLAHFGQVVITFDHVSTGSIFAGRFDSV